MLRNLSVCIRSKFVQSLCTMADAAEPTMMEDKPKHSGKREYVDTEDTDDSKRPKLQSNEERKNDNLPYKKKKMALMMAYCGKGYQGMQINPGCNTIEKVLVEALVISGCINKSHAFKLSNMSFQRAARTDKGVSAAGQVISLKMFSDVVNPIVKINAQLPEHIKVVSLKRVTKGFDSKNACTGRTYAYLMPTYAFTNFADKTVLDYRIPAETLTKINEVLAIFKGTHNFHNFTSGKLPNDKSAYRYITEFKIGEPFIRKDMEFAIIKIEGQSFMMHQIRKMIGITIAIVQDLADTTSIDKAWEPAKCDIPKAPGLGLMLDKCHYTFYNKKFGETHDKLDWDDLKEEIDEFKEKHIYSTIIDTEVEEKSMMVWLKTLHLHTFDDTKQETTSGKMMRLHRLTQKDELSKLGDDSSPAAESGSDEDEEEAAKTETPTEDAEAKTQTEDDDITQSKDENKSSDSNSEEETKDNDEEKKSEEET